MIGQLTGNAISFGFYDSRIEAEKAGQAQISDLFASPFIRETLVLS